MISILLAGCSAPVMPVMTMTAIMTTSIAAMMMNQRLSLRTTIDSGIKPSSSGRCCGCFGDSANGPSRHEEEEIECHPANEEQPDCDSRDDERANRAVLKRLGGIARTDGCGDMLPCMGGGMMWLASHRLTLPA